MANTMPKMLLDNADLDKNEYYDILTTEECFVFAVDTDDLEIGENIILGYN